MAIAAVPAALLERNPDEFKPDSSSKGEVPLFGAGRHALGGRITICNLNMRRVRGESYTFIGKKF